MESSYTHLCMYVYFCMSVYVCVFTWYDQFHNDMIMIMIHTLHCIYTNVVLNHTYMENIIINNIIIKLGSSQRHAFYMRRWTLKKVEYAMHTNLWKYHIIKLNLSRSWLKLKAGARFTTTNKLKSNIIKIWDILSNLREFISFVFALKIKIIEIESFNQPINQSILCNE